LEPTLKEVIKAAARPLDAAGAPRSERQLAQVSLEGRAKFVREQILALNNIIDEARRRGANYAVNIGRALLVTKAELHHGEFGAWIEHKCKLAPSTAKLYMMLARRAGELKKQGVNLNGTSIRTMRAIVSQPQARAKLLGRPQGSEPDQRARDNDLQRCILLLNHLCEYGDLDQVEEKLLPELTRVLSELKKRKTRREATRTTQTTKRKSSRRKANSKGT
jgi:hypothetical protein